MAEKQVVLGSCNQLGDWLVVTYYAAHHWPLSSAHLQAGYAMFTNIIAATLRVKVSCRAA